MHSVTLMRATRRARFETRCGLHLPRFRQSSLLPRPSPAWSQARGLRGRQPGVGVPPCCPPCPPYLRLPGVAAEWGSHKPLELVLPKCLGWEWGMLQETHRNTNVQGSCSLKNKTTPQDATGRGHRRGAPGSGGGRAVKSRCSSPAFAEDLGMVSTPLPPHVSSSPALTSPWCRMCPSKTISERIFKRKLIYHAGLWSR